MNKDPDIRATLQRHLHGLDGDSVLPASTLRKARWRRRVLAVSAGVGGLGLTASAIFGYLAIDPPTKGVDPAPVSTPSTQKEEPRPDGDPVTIKEERDPKGPPLVTVSTPEKRLRLAAWSYCYDVRCIAGGSRPNPPSIGSPQEVRVEFPLPDWKFTAAFTPTDEDCGRQQQAPLEEADDGSLLLRPVGPADTYDVTLRGNGEGDLSVSFRWTTPSDGPLAEPEARAAIVSGEGKRIVSYGVELQVTNLAETPDEARATITVEAADGDSVTFEAERERSRCWSEGTVYWDGPDDMGLQAAELGPGPFSYTVVLLLDGRRYVGSAEWPQDEIRGEEPSVSLRFTPALPGPS